MNLFTSTGQKICYVFRRFISNFLLHALRAVLSAFLARATYTAETGCSHYMASAEGAAFDENAGVSAIRAHQAKLLKQASPKSDY
jgi:hypothetical protein